MAPDCILYATRSYTSDDQLDEMVGNRMQPIYVKKEISQNDVTLCVCLTSQYAVD